MVLASLFFATMSVCIKYASAHFNLVELVCYRGAIGIVFMATWCHVRGVSLKSPVPMMHVWRRHRRCGLPDGLVLRHCQVAAGHGDDAELHERHLGGGFSGRRHDDHGPPAGRRTPGPHRADRDGGGSPA
jgi:hypothetical protein